MAEGRGQRAEGGRLMADGGGRRAGEAESRRTKTEGLEVGRRSAAALLKE